MLLCALITIDRACSALVFTIDNVNTICACVYLESLGLIKQWPTRYKGISKVGMLVVGLAMVRTVGVLYFTSTLQTCIPLQFGSSLDPVWIQFRSSLDPVWIEIGSSLDECPVLI